MSWRTKTYAALEDENINLKRRVYRLSNAHASLQRQVRLLSESPEQGERAALIAASEDHQLQAARFYDESVALRADIARLRARLEEALAWQRA